MKIYLILLSQSPLDTDVGKTSALGAVLFSQHMSRPKMVDPKDNKERVSDGPVYSNGTHTPIAS